VHSEGEQNHLTRQHDIGRVSNLWPWPTGCVMQPMTISIHYKQRIKKLHKKFRLLGVPNIVNFLHVWSHKPAHNYRYGPLHTKVWTSLIPCFKKKSHNTLVQYGCILAKQVPLLTIPNVIVKQWFKAAATNSIKCH
jgi:hypothetical protein